MTKQKKKKNKSAYSDLEYMAMAANIEAISYNSSTERYDIEFFGSINNHSVEIIDWNDSFVELLIIEGSNQYTSEIDKSLENVIISNLGTYTFSQFEDIEIQTNNYTIMNLTSIIPAFHDNETNGSLTFDNNGSQDTFPADNSGKRRFWGKYDTFFHTSGGMNGTPCYNTYNRCTYRFWILVGCELVTDPTPVPCV